MRDGGPAEGRRGGPRHRPPEHGHPRPRGEVRRARRATAQGAGGSARSALEQSPFEQAKRQQAPARPQARRRCPTGRRGPSRAPATRVAFPDVDLASLPRGHVLLGPDAPPRARPRRRRRSRRPRRSDAGSSGAFAFWLGDGTQGGAARRERRARSSTSSSPRPSSLHRLVRGRIEDDRAELLAASREQALILNRDPLAPARGRRSGRQRQVDARRREGPPARRARATGRCSSASTSASRRRSCASSAAPGAGAGST